MPDMSFLGSLADYLTEEDEQDISSLQKSGQTFKAVDLMLSKLMEAREPGWYSKLLETLHKHQASFLVDELEKTRQESMKEDWFSTKQAEKVSERRQ